MRHMKINFVLLLIFTLFVGIITQRNKIRTKYYFYRLTNSSLSEEQRSSAASNLGFLGQFSEPYLVMGLQDEDVVTRRVSMRSLFLMSRESDLELNSVNGIIAHIEKEDDSDVRIYGFRAIINSIPELSKVNKIVDDALNDSSLSVRLMAIQAFTKIRFHEPKVIIPQLIKMLSDPEVRLYAKNYLKLYTGKEFDDNGADASKWIKWWDENKYSFKPEKFWH